MRPIKIFYILAPTLSHYSLICTLLFKKKLSPSMIFQYHNFTHVISIWNVPLLPVSSQISTYSSRLISNATNLMNHFSPDKVKWSCFLLPLHLTQPSIIAFIPIYYNCLFGDLSNYYFTVGRGLCLF